MSGYSANLTASQSAITFPNPLTLHGVPKRRAAAGKLIAGVAAVANVDSFKGETQHLHKPLAKRWDRKCTHATPNSAHLRLNIA